MFLGLNNLILGLGVAMTPQERFRAMGRFDSGGGMNTDFLTNEWVQSAGWVAIALLIIVLLMRYKGRIKQQQLKTERNFCDNSARLRLNGEEQEIVAAIATLAGIKQKDSIFTHRHEFDAGLNQLMRTIFSTGQNPVERQKFHEDILSIKTKLEFIGNPLQNGSKSRNGKEHTSQQIPVGTEVWLLPQSNNTGKRFCAEVIGNDSFEFSLHLKGSATCQPGDTWTVRYNNGSMQWEFEAIATACSQDTISLAHSEHIRYVNRRQFTRVSTDKPAKIALFPIFGQVNESKQMELSFVPAVITEIAGPCLRVRTGLSVQIRQRVLLVFDLEEGRLVQDVGEVRDIRNSDTEDEIIIELIGLHAKAIGELVRVANQIAHNKAHDMAEEQMEVMS